MWTLRASIFLFLFAMLVATLGARSAAACACCAEAGQRLDLSEKLEHYETQLREEFAFAAEAALFSTAADWAEQVRGISNPSQSYAYSLKVDKASGSWTFSLQDAEGNSGTLNFTLPANMRKLYVDPAPEPPQPEKPMNTLLYKEWQLVGRVTGTGIFTLGRKRQASATLILHGRGNLCSDSSQFLHWTLDVTGADTNFRFFGRLQPMQ